MEESSANATRGAAPPAPPRWKGIQSLDLVHQLNERCIDLLCEVASSTDPDVTLSIVAENREPWARLADESRRALARVPFVIVDAHFLDALWWRRILDGANTDDTAGVRQNGLPREASEHLMHETTMFAWQTARWDRTAARLSLGMSPSVTEIIAALTPQQIRVIAARESQAIRVRWADDAPFWRDLLLAATAGDQKRLAALHLHAKLLLCSELAQVRD